MVVSGQWMVVSSGQWSVVTWSVSGQWSVVCDHLVSGPVFRSQWSVVGGWNSEVH